MTILENQKKGYRSIHSFGGMTHAAHSEISDILKIHSRIAKNVPCKKSQIGFAPPSFEPAKFYFWFVLEFWSG